MKSIWKYKLEVTGRQVVDMPEGAKILTVQTQGVDVPCIWAEVEVGAPLYGVEVFTYGTGGPLGEMDGVEYLGTYQISSGALVFHVYVGARHLKKI